MKDVVTVYPREGCGECSADETCSKCTRVLHPLRFFKLEETAGIIIALVRALMTPSSILSGDSFYADMRIFNEISR